ncbi:hypothetical protein [Microbacterium immunditiarum]|uniref:Uncharacterized protein n=1 Tax=Microbacterium immunditiarum TaxID=337480 RepID=A0A7Y9GMU4_9MICO|nr:hypothetical protein [Microbacterium immunditiarum]NYE19366.1 hypothetical protein [Microbacterium immunditiarum]
MRRSRASRALRGTVAASVATFVALLSHVASGGGLPGWLGIVVPWVLSVMVCTLLAGRALSLVRLAGAVALSQLLFHALFVLGTGAPSPAVAGHHHGGTTTPLPALGDEATAMLVADSAMWVSHAIAAVVTVVVLYRGEQAIMRLRGILAELRAWAVRFVARVVPVPLPAPVAASLGDAASGWHVARSPELSPLVRRGPPFLLAH